MTSECRVLFSEDSEYDDQTTACICNERYFKCPAEEHMCICKLLSKSKNENQEIVCKGSHGCTCSKTINGTINGSPNKCLLNNFNSYGGFYKHACICAEGITFDSEKNMCIAESHFCVCKFLTAVEGGSVSKCLYGDNHECICSFNPFECRLKTRFPFIDVTHACGCNIKPEFCRLCTY